MADERPYNKEEIAEAIKIVLDAGIPSLNPDDMSELERIMERLKINKHIE